MEPERERASPVGPDLDRPGPSTQGADIDFGDAGRDAREVGGDKRDAGGGGGRAPGPSKVSGMNPLVKWVGVGVVLAAAAFAWFNKPTPPTDETKFPNWNQHVVKLNEQNPVKEVSKGGVEKVFAAAQTTIRVADADTDRATTDGVKAALAAGDMNKANELLRGAQKIPDVQMKEAQGQPLQQIKPTITEGMKQQVLSGDDGRFVHIFLFDSCAEDGDVVDIVLNGAVFARVPITHKGATLSVPVSSASTTTIALRGVYDGGGGITVACRTSVGDYFGRAMGVGEATILGTVGR